MTRGEIVRAGVVRAGVGAADDGNGVNEGTGDRPPASLGAVNDAAAGAVGTLEGTSIGDEDPDVPPVRWRAATANVPTTNTMATKPTSTMRTRDREPGPER